MNTRLDCGTECNNGTQQVEPSALALLVASRVSEYLTLGMHHTTKDGQREMAK